MLISEPSFLLTLALLLGLPGAGQAQSVSPCQTNANSSATVILPDTLTQTVGPAADPLEGGASPDSVAIFTSDGTCVGVEAWTDGGDGVTISAAGSGSQIEGLDSNEPMRFKIYDASRGQIDEGLVTYASRGPDDVELQRDDGLYEQGAVFVLDLLASHLPEDGNVHVDGAAAAGGDGSTASPYDNLLDGLRNVGSGDTVFVAGGTYSGGVPMPHGAALAGGFASDFGSRDVAANATVLEGGHQARVLFVNNEQASTNTTIDGVTIQGGRAQAGAGIEDVDGSATLRNVIFRDNEATASGGGGAGRFTNATVTMKNVLASGNAATSGSAGAFRLNAGGNRIEIVNATISGNRAGSDGGALYIQNPGASSTLTNTILWNNSAGGSGNQAVVTSSGLTISYSDVQGGAGSISNATTGSGNVAVDPLFNLDVASSNAPTQSGDLHVRTGSPVVDAGAASGVSLPANDLHLEPRQQDQVDIGAYERAALDQSVGTNGGWRDAGLPAGRHTPLSNVLVGGTAFQNSSHVDHIYTWNDDDASFSNAQGGWTEVTDATAQNMPPGRGFTTYLFQHSSPGASQDFTVASGLHVPGRQSVTVGDGTDVNGNALSGSGPSADAALSSSAQFHFLANPYPVPYDLDALDLSGGFSSVVQLWDTSLGSYTLLDTEDADASTGIQPWQAFFLERISEGSGAQTVTFDADGRHPPDGTANSYLGEKSTATPARSIQLQITARDDAGSILARDRAATLLFHPAAAEGWGHRDASKLLPVTASYVAIGPVGPSRDDTPTIKAQEARPEPIDGVEIPLGLRHESVSGSVTLEPIRWENIPDDWTVSLIDTKGTARASDDEAVELGASDGYTFELASSASTPSPKGQPSVASRPMLLAWRPHTPPAPAAKASPDSTSMARFTLRVDPSGGPIPVELTRFNAALDDRRAVLSWTTASETRNAGFYVEHQRLAPGDTATHPRAWASLGFVEGGGTTSAPQSYQFDAPALIVGRHAFRLRQVDQDGTPHYSHVARLERRTGKPVVVKGPAPNPSRTRASIHVAVQTAQKVSVQVYDVLGRRVATAFQGSLPAQEARPIQIQTSSLSSGVYFIRVTGTDFSTTTRMTVVE